MNRKTKVLCKAMRSLDSIILNSSKVGVFNSTLHKSSNVKTKLIFLISAPPQKITSFSKRNSTRNTKFESPLDIQTIVCYHRHLMHPKQMQHTIQDTMYQCLMKQCSIKTKHQPIPNYKVQIVYQHALYHQR